MIISGLRGGNVSCLQKKNTQPCSKSVFLTSPIVQDTFVSSQKLAQPKSRLSFMRDLIQYRKPSRPAQFGTEIAKTSILGPAKTPIKTVVTLEKGVLGKETYRMYSSAGEELGYLEMKSLHHDPQKGYKEGDEDGMPYPKTHTMAKYGNKPQQEPFIDKVYIANIFSPFHDNYKGIGQKLVQVAYERAKKDCDGRVMLESYPLGDECPHNFYHKAHFKAMDTQIHDNGRSYHLPGPVIDEILETQKLPDQLAQKMDEKTQAKMLDSLYKRPVYFYLDEAGKEFWDSRACQDPLL